LNVVDLVRRAFERNAATHWLKNAFFNARSWVNARRSTHRRLALRTKLLTIILNFSARDTMMLNSCISCTLLPPRVRVFIRVAVLIAGDIKKGCQFMWPPRRIDAHRGCQFESIEYRGPVSAATIRVERGGARFD
jgi:hypothetical protein